MTANNAMSRDITVSGEKLVSVPRSDFIQFNIPRLVGEHTYIIAPFRDIDRSSKICGYYHRCITGMESAGEFQARVISSKKGERYGES